MRKLLLVGGILAAIGLLTPASALAVAPGAVVDPVPAFAGGAVTITVECSHPTGLVSFPGDPTLFQGGGAFASQPQGAFNFTLLNGLAPGNYPVVFTCIIIVDDVDGRPQTITEAWTALVVVAGKPPTATPSGAPQTGGGFSQTGSGKTLGLAAIAAAGLLGGATLLLRRRRAM
ncbi:hypothetical protein [Catelliglobosispora koreensis]|uniref:hypothetical protein n=1 Tax=Catelliglobosispora koreensis TaxID=129052 RepID=UPI00035F4820|nr:hypothetical protein [Catelliglobosispora koreensis]